MTEHEPDTFPLSVHLLGKLIQDALDNDTTDHGTIAHSEYFGERTANAAVYAWRRGELDIGWYPSIQAPSPGMTHAARPGEDENPTTHLQQIAVGGASETAAGA